MGKNRFASADTVRLELTEGDWIEVKSEISYGERQTLIAAGVQASAGADGKSSVVMDFAAINVRDMATWIVDWSFCDAKGKPVAVSVAAIEALNEETAAEVDAALKAHKLRAEKNAPTTAGSTE